MVIRLGGAIGSNYVGFAINTPTRCSVSCGGGYYRPLHVVVEESILIILIILFGTTYGGGYRFK